MVYLGFIGINGGEYWIKLGVFFLPLTHFSRERTRERVEYLKIIYTASTQPPP
jgi:hypothetical protein